MDKKIKDFISDFFHKEHSLKEQNLFWDSFLKLKDEVAKEKGLFNIWNQIGDRQPDMDDESRQALERFKLSIGTSTEKRSLRISLLLKYAAIFLLPVFVGLSIWMYTGSQVPEMITLSANNAILTPVALPDGTKVMLNAKTTIKYPAKFTGDRREVELEGEANFAVAHNKKQPFVVKTSKVEITALGTKFNVRTYNKEKIVTTLEEGSIKITAPGSSLIVKPGEQVTYIAGKQSFQTETVDTSNVLGWTKGELFFNNASLSDILEEIERYYDITLSIKGSLNDKILYNIKYQNGETLDEVLKVLCGMVGYISYKIVDDTHVEINSTK